MQNKIWATALIITSSIIFAGCGTTTKPATQNNSDTAPAVEQKVGDTTKTGVISKNEGGFFLQEAGKTPVLIDSYEIELSAYVGQTVTVTGQYSGDTLFVGEVK